MMWCATPTGLHAGVLLCMVHPTGGGCAREAAVTPLKTVPYHTDAPFPSVTSPMTAALGAMNASCATVGARLPTLMTVRCLNTACDKGRCQHQMKRHRQQLSGMHAQQVVLCH